MQTFTPQFRLLEHSGPCDRGGSRVRGVPTVSPPIVGPDPSRSAGDVSLPASCAARSHRRKDPVPTPSGGRESGALRPTSPALRWPAARR
jgi:hypothetical protein